MDWQKAINMDFVESMVNIKALSTNEHGKLRLMNIFIAKTRWDVMMEGLDFKDVVTLTGVTTINDDLHRIILCNYIRVRSDFNSHTFDREVQEIFDGDARLVGG